MGSAPSRGRRQTFGSVLMKQFPNLSEFGSLCTTLTRNAREARISFDCFQILAEIQVNTVNTKWSPYLLALALFHLQITMLILKYGMIFRL